MAIENKTDVQRQMEDAAAAAAGAKPKPDGTKIVPTPTPTPTNIVDATSEFKDERDPKYPYPSNPEVECRAKEPYKTRLDSGIQVQVYRFHKKGTPVDAFVDADYVLQDSNVLTAGAKEAIQKENEKMKAMKDSFLAKIGTENGNTYRLQTFIRKFTKYIHPIVPSDVETELATKVVTKNKDTKQAQIEITPILRQKGTGPIRAHVLLVPQRAYDMITSGQTGTDEVIEEVLSETTPQLKLITISKSDFATSQISIFGGAIEVAAEFFDPDTSKVARVSDIPSISGLAAGVEYITYEIDNSKCFVLKSVDVPAKGPAETDEAFEARKKRFEARMALTEKYRSDTLTINDKASIIRTRNTMHPSLATGKNYLPLATFDMISIGEVLNPKTAAELNSVYLKRLTSKNTGGGTFALTQDAQASVQIVGGEIQSSYYFPADAFMAKKITQINRLYRTRKSDGTVSKDAFVPKRVIKKFNGKKADGTNVVQVAKHSIGTSGYSTVKYNQVKGLFDECIAKLPDAMKEGIAYLTPEEISKAVSKASTGGSSNNNRPLSATTFDKTAVDLNTMMADLALGDGKIIVAANQAQELIKSVKERQVTVKQSPVKFTPEKLKQLMGKDKA